MTFSLTAGIHARGTAHTFTPEFTLVLYLTKHSDIPWFYYPAQRLYPATSFFVLASKPFIQQMAGSTDVIEVFSMITDSGGPWLLRSKLPRVLPTKERKAPFQVKS